MTRLSNADFFAVRHGQSMANVAGLIVSNPDTATQSFGLTPTGRAAAENAAKAAIDLYSTSDAQEGQRLDQSNDKDLSPPSSLLNKQYQGVVIVSSDLLRAKETATILAHVIQEAKLPLYVSRDQTICAAALGEDHNKISLDVRLRERWFGEWDATSDANYEAVWVDDAVDSSHTNKGVESVDSVIDRATDCIVAWNDLLGRSSTESNNDEDSASLPFMVLCVAHGDVLQILQTAFEKMDGRLHRSLPHLETAQLRPLVLAASQW